MTAVEHVLPVKCRLGEGPLWSARDQQLYWVDAFAGIVHSYHPASGAHQSTVFDDWVTCIAIRKSGGFVLAMRRKLAYWDGSSAGVETLAEPFPADKPEMRFNDGAVDPAGRFWIGGVTANEYAAPLLRFDADHSVHEMDSGFSVSNGIAWSPDRKTMLFTDSPPRKIYAYHYDLASGAIRGRRVFADVPTSLGVPDGLTIDSAGYVWSAHWDGWRLTRYAPDGSIDRVVPLPVARVTSCIFGGPNLTDLYITSAAPAENDSMPQPYAGNLFRLQVDVPGQPEPEFAG
ncbi:MAG: SMP-30/gluconolactonase/LRE family protein [Chloroflexi bacterium]|nr:SMP-30/gluconolactonase/LRE family protein [Chloroflexota bacterium]MBV6437446.1 6-deoxy-6-sulfogluconolactonase [Anaerolineae bacterium]MDL1916604.1 SMP-30/gluconolactonase/LRE family protein [Anaerolineae bacterium CFX4]OQY79967.1 MAG: hypothetical protein B6D42_13915 [Anaerolineae bacterium UTCFX5]MCC6566025.1 SMP-30/gluconolactonase/LRE family protein [Chloroflexota bacterium]